MILYYKGWEGTGRDGAGRDWIGRAVWYGTLNNNDNDNTYEHDHVNNHDNSSNSSNDTSELGAGPNTLDLKFTPNPGSKRDESEETN